MALRQRVMFLAVGSVVAILVMLVAIWLVFGRVVARPICKIAGGSGRADERPRRRGALHRARRRDRRHRQGDRGVQAIDRREGDQSSRAPGLDVVRSNVMIADDDYNIMYMNTTLQSMLREAEAGTAQGVPRFRRHKLIGANMDVFHKNPAHQRKMLDSLTGTHESSDHGRQPEIPPGRHAGHRQARQARRHGRRMAQRDGREGDRGRGRRHRQGGGRRRLLPARSARRQERASCSISPPR